MNTVYKITYLLLISDSHCVLYNGLCRGLIGLLNMTREKQKSVFSTEKNIINLHVIHKLFRLGGSFSSFIQKQFV